MLRAAGARNVFGEVEKTYLPVDAERIVERDPDVILDVTIVDNHLGHWALLPQLKAVREGRVHPFPRVRPGTQIPAWIEKLERLVNARQR